MIPNSTTAGDEPSLADASGHVLAEFERLRQTLGFCSEPAPLIADRFRLEQVIGRGAMGVVHLAHDHRLQRSVALKLVRAGARLDPLELQARLEREALALAKVAHPNVVGIHDVGRHGDQTFIAMQFVAGTTLREWQQDPSRTPAQVLDAYLQAARGLAAAHAAGVIHRDFKPDNVLVGDDGIVRVVDFGIAAAQLSDASSSSSIESGLQELSGGFDSATSPTSPTLGSATPHPMTRPGLLGTLPYMAPEQLEARSVDGRADQFGFCVALWEALTGARPFAGRRIARLLDAIAAGPSDGQSLPRWLQPLLRRGLAFLPAQRWPDMPTLIRALERGRGRRRRRALGLGLGLALASSGVIGHALAPASVAAGERCDDFVASIDLPWTAARRDAITELARSDAAAGEYVITRVDRLASDWRSAARASCSAELAPAEHDPQRACLSDWLEALDAHLELLVEYGDAKTLARAPDLLARLTPPDGDYCALRPSQPVEPEVWRLAERARAAIVLGEFERAQTQAEAALARAAALHERDARADQPALNADAATAHAARAEVAAFSGERELAFAEFAEAQRHALGSGRVDVLLSSWVLWAKLLALGGDEQAAERAFEHLARAEPLIVALELGARDPRRAELLEARGLGERARGDQRAAIELHRRARELFVAAEQPTLAVKSLVNIGANHQELAQPERAEQAYAEALELLERAGLPPSYRNRVQLERNLGLLAHAASQRAGLERFRFVFEHGSPEQRLEAADLLISLAVELESEDALVREWSERALAELAAQPGVALARSVRLRRTLGVALARLDDERGQVLLHQVERDAVSLEPALQFDIQRDWILMLEDAGRCDEARERRQRVVARIDPLTDPPPAYAAWRDAGPSPTCEPGDPNDDPRNP